MKPIASLLGVPMLGLALAAAGCATPKTPPVTSPVALRTNPPTVQLAALSPSAGVVRPVAHQERDGAPAPPPVGPSPDGAAHSSHQGLPSPPDGVVAPSMVPDSNGHWEQTGPLALDWLIDEVQRVNPSVQAAIEAWRAAASRYPQVVSLEDPMFGFTKGLNMGFMVEASQKIPFPGKRPLRGAAADAEANAACHDIQDTKLQLVEAASLAYFDYYQTMRETQVNGENEQLLAEFKQLAQTRYEAGQATQQDVYQAEVELVTLAARTAELRRARAVAIARINTLLHRPADCPLPPPPVNLSVAGELPATDVLQSIAVRQRPDLSSQLARVEAEEARVGIACKEYYPDMELVYRHDEYMDSTNMYNQIGMNVNVPLYRAKRNAALCEAEAKARQQRAEYRRRVDEVSFEVHAAARRIEEGRTILGLYEKRILPTVKANIESARENYVAGRLDFLRLIEAQRQLRDQQDRYYQAQAELHRRLAELRRAVGGNLPIANAT